MKTVILRVTVNIPAVYLVIVISLPLGPAGERGESNRRGKERQLRTCHL